MATLDLQHIASITELADQLAQERSAVAIDDQLSVKQQEMKLREQLVIQTANDLLSTKGFEAMTVDEVAERVGIAKPSLYRHFKGKESLGVAVLLDALKQSHAFLLALKETQASDFEKLQSAAMWCLIKKAAKQMPTLPSQNSALRDLLKSNTQYVDLLIEVSDLLGEWIDSTQEQGQLNPEIPGIVVLYTIYARACDPVLDFLIDGGFAQDEAIAQVMKSCFSGLTSR